jgi:hypothetical protein
MSCNQAGPWRPQLKRGADLFRMVMQERPAIVGFSLLTFLSTTNSFSAAVRRLVSTSYLWTEDSKDLSPFGQLTSSSCWLGECLGCKGPSWVSR